MPPLVSVCAVAVSAHRAAMKTSSESHSTRGYAESRRSVSARRCRIDGRGHGLGFFIGLSVKPESAMGFCGVFILMIVAYI